MFRLLHFRDPVTGISLVWPLVSLVRRSMSSMSLFAICVPTPAYERLVDTYDDLWAVNRPHVQRLGRVFRMACAAIVLEVVLWALQLALS